MDVETLMWDRVEAQEGVFDGFLVKATRLIAEERGQNGFRMHTGWHTTSSSYPLGDGERTYLVVGKQFYKITIFTMVRGLVRIYENAEAVKDPLDFERQSILKAIAEWAMREPDSATG